jgi:hypothetical protein
MGVEMSSMYKILREYKSTGQVQVTQKKIKEEDHNKYHWWVC